MPCADTRAAGPEIRTRRSRKGKGGTSAVGEHDLSELPARLHAFEALARPVHRQHLVDDGAHTRGGTEGEQVLQLVLGAHRGTDDLELQEEDPGEFGVRGPVTAR